ncbi:MAG TPA: hypothetical protein VGY99_05490 [Candidatus Binataceae bacterium]|nr:hypothetical protein [Candidatus Binataceae bacterium]
MRLGSAATIVLLFAALVLYASVGGAAVDYPNQSEANSLREPPISDGNPVAVAVALGLLNVTDIDEVGQRFHVNAYIFMRWQDPRLKYVPTPHQPDANFYAKGDIWSPTVEVVNAVDPRQSYDTKLKANADGAVKYTERFSVAATSKFALRSFPFDTQTLELVIRPYVGERKDFSLMADARRTRMVPEFKTYSSLASWEVRGFDVQGATAQGADGEPVSEVRFQLSLKRKSAFYVYKVIIPLLLMVALSWTVFWVDPTDLATQVQIAVTTVLTVIAFAFAISASLPRVPYLTFIDAFFLTCYVFVFIAIIELMSVHLFHRTREGDIAIRIRRHSRWAVPLAFLVANLVLVIRFKVV